MPQNLLCHLKAVFPDRETGVLGAAVGLKRLSGQCPPPDPPQSEASAHPPLSPGFLLAAMLDDHVDVNRPDVRALWVGAQCALKNGPGTFCIPQLELKLGKLGNDIHVYREKMAQTQKAERRPQHNT